MITGGLNNTSQWDYWWVLQQWRQQRNGDSNNSKGLATTMIKDAGEEKGDHKREEGTIWFRNNEKKKW